MITILQAPCGIAPNRLQVGSRVGRVAHLFVSWWNCERGEPLHHRTIANDGPVLAQVTKALAAPLTPPSQILLLHIAQAKAAGHRARWRQTASKSPELRDCLSLS